MYIIVISFNRFQGVLKARFRCLLSKLRFRDVRDSCEMIEVCAALNNFILFHNSEAFFQDYFDEVESTPATQNTAIPVPLPDDFFSSSSSSSEDEHVPVPAPRNRRVVSNSEKIVFKYRAHFQ